MVNTMACSLHVCSVVPDLKQPLGQGFEMHDMAATPHIVTIDGKKCVSVFQPRGRA